MIAPVMQLEEFTPLFHSLLRAEDAAGLGELYCDNAILTTVDGPFGDAWVVGRSAIVGMITGALSRYSMVEQAVVASTIDRRGDDQAARFMTFESTVQSKQGGNRFTMTVNAIEIFERRPGWKYLADHSRVVSITRT